MNIISAMWNCVPNIRSRLPTMAGGSTPVATTPPAIASEKKLQELSSTLKGLTSAAWQPDNSWSPLMKIQKTLTYLQSNPNLISTNDYEALYAQFNSIKGPEDIDLPNASTLFQQLQQAKSQLRENDTPENQFQVTLAEYQLERGRLNTLGGATNEVRSYASLLDARNQLRFEIQIHSPETTDYKVLLPNGATIPIPLREVVQAYKDALNIHGNNVMAWVTGQNESSTELLERAQHEIKSNSNDIVWQGREEVLTGRVKLIEEHVVKHFDTFFNTYQTQIDKAFESTLDKIFPSRVKKGFVNALVRQIVWAWESVFGSQDTETRNNLTILARTLRSEKNRAKPKTMSQYCELFQTYNLIKFSSSDQLRAESLGKIDSAKDSFNQSVTDILGGESLAHYFPEPPPVDAGPQAFTVIR